MPMRVECKNYESRTYPSGETVRMCRLDLAPEAPWRCPENCAKFELRLASGGWTEGSLSTTPAPDEPPSFKNGDVGALLNSAEDVVNAVGEQVAAEVRREREERQEAERKNAATRRWWKFWK